MLQKKHVTINGKQFEILYFDDSTKFANLRHGTYGGLIHIKYSNGLISNITMNDIFRESEQELLEIVKDIVLQNTKFYDNFDIDYHFRSYLEVDNGQVQMNVSDWYQNIDIKLKNFNSFTKEQVAEIIKNRENTRFVADVDTIGFHDITDDWGTKFGTQTIELPPLNSANDLATANLQAKISTEQNSPWQLFTLGLTTSGAATSFTKIGNEFEVDIKFLGNL